LQTKLRIHCGLRANNPVNEERGKRAGEKSHSAAVSSLCSCFQSTHGGRAVRTENPT
jgi:hypothetical protein